jgi:hypothetical protein
VPAGASALSNQAEREREMMFVVSCVHVCDLKYRRRIRAQ